MIRLLLANGCSFTRGEELEDPGAQAWPAVLGRMLGLPVANLARDWASNRRIVRTTVAQLAARCEEAGVRPDEVLVVILWTAMERHEYYHPGQLMQWYVGGRPIIDNWEDIGPWRSGAGHRPSRAFYKHLYSSEGQSANLCVDWLMLDAFLREEGCQAKYAFATPELEHVPQPAQWFAGHLPVDDTYGGLSPALRDTFTGLASGRGCSPNGFPLADSHRLFATKLADWMRRRSPVDGLFEHVSDT